ncbi:MAG TPA: helix-hairpin-helix domain-containing protein [Chitinophagaceae bacterium]
MNWRQFVKDYLSFTRRERIGLLVLFFLIAVIFLLPSIVSNRNSSPQVPADTAWISAAKKLELKDPEKDKNLFNPQSGDNDNAYQYDRPVSSSSSSGGLFYFDPNTLDKAGWKKLGIKDKTIDIIQNYLTKGGHFYKTEDLKKIYGLHPNDYFRLEPYIKIESTRLEEKSADYVKKEIEPKRLSYNSIDINTADTTAFISLPGIGSKLAARIVNFRDKLGGFYSIAQVGETYGLPDSTFQKVKQYLKLDNTEIRKININTANVDELKAHPYIKYSIANPIIAYRNEHGPFLRVEDIKKVMVVTDDIFNKISPYLTIE